MPKPSSVRAAHYPVIVIGAGPIGLTLCNLLGTYGVRSLLVERNATTVQEPRAVSIDDESLRTMQACGMIDEVMTQVVKGYGSEYYTPGGTRFLKVEPKAQPYGYPRRNAFRQPVFEGQMKKGLDRFTHVETRFGWTLKSFAQNEEGVRIEISDGQAEPVYVTCDYLVGCDGANSFVRTQLGLVLEGETFSEKWLIIDLENSPTSSRETQVFCDVKRPCIALPGPEFTRRFEFKLLMDEVPDEMTSDENVSALLATPIYDVAPQSQIRRKVVYTFHARLAPTWAVGRVFLAGDSCHLTPPFAGQGMNSGIRDSFNLAWKLKAVLNGQMPAKVLDTYEQERREHVGEMIELALRMGRIMGPKSYMHGLVTQSLFRAASIWPRLRDYFAEMKYKPKPRFVRGFLIPDNASAKTTCVGRLLPQPSVMDQNGDGCPLDTVLGADFALIAVTDDLAAFDALTALPVFQSLKVRKIAISNAPLPRFPNVAVINDTSGVLTRLIQGPDVHNRRNFAVLVRPDRYVSARFDLDDVPAIAERLNMLISSEKPTAMSLESRLIQTGLNLEHRVSASR